MRNPITPGRPDADRELLAELEEIIRTMPPAEEARQLTPLNFALHGRIQAALLAYDMTEKIGLDRVFDELASDIYWDNAYRKLMVRLHRAVRSLQIKTGAGLNAAIEQGGVFRYFDSLRRIIETAKTDLLFVDRYLNNDFVSDYLAAVPASVSVRLLTSKMDPKHFAGLVPAVRMLAAQNKSSIEVRTLGNPHDRLVLVDGVRCFLSGASFKDGAKSSTTVLVELTDTFDPIKTFYEQDWAKGTVEFP